MNQERLKILMISSDRKILETESAVSLRMKEYGELVDELHIVLLSDNAHQLKETELSKNVWVYPTNSSTKWFRSIGAVRLGKKIIFDKKFVRGKSLIVTQDPFECGWAGLRVKNKWRIPIEVQLHTDPFSDQFGGILNTLRKGMAKKVIINADSLRVVSGYLATKIIEEFSIPAERIVVLPIYVDLARLDKSQDTFDLHARFGWHFIILAVSRLTTEKNLPMALEVLSKLLKFFPTTGLVIVGEGPEESRLKSLCQKLDIESHVAFAGWQEDLGSYYHSANLFIQTSNFEGYGLSLIEAGLAGLPIATTAVGIANDLENGKDALVCPVGDSDFMFKAVYDIMKDDGRRELLRRSIKQKLASILISKEVYMQKLLANWQNTASKIHE